MKTYHIDIRKDGCGIWKSLSGTPIWTGETIETFPAIHVYSTKFYERAIPCRNPDYSLNLLKPTKKRSVKSWFIDRQLVTPEIERCLRVLKQYKLNRDYGIVRDALEYLKTHGMFSIDRI